MTIREFREKVNLLIYDAKPRVLRILSALNVLVSLTAIAVLIYSYGFTLTPEAQAYCFGILEVTFGFYILRFLTKLFFDFDPPTFLRNNWFEAIIIGLLLIEGIAYNLFDTMIIEPIFESIGFSDLVHFQRSSFSSLSLLSFSVTYLKNRNIVHG